MKIILLIIFFIMFFSMAHQWINSSQGKIQDVEKEQSLLRFKFFSCSVLALTLIYL